MEPWLLALLLIGGVLLLGFLVYWFWYRKQSSPRPTSTESSNPLMYDPDWLREARQREQENPDDTDDHVLPHNFLY